MSSVAKERNISQGTIKYVHTPERLDECLDDLSKATVLGLDTETTGLVGEEQTKVSLIQLAIRRGSEITVWVIDCMADLDLTDLLDLLSDQRIRKAIHYAQFDTAILRDCLQLELKNVWCTFTAERRACVKRGLKLSDLAARHFGIKLDKSHQRDDWSVRPLTREQLHYAGLDTRIVLEIYFHQRKLGFNGFYDRSRSARQAEKETRIADQIVLFAPVADRMDAIGASSTPEPVKLAEDLDGRAAKLKWLRHFIASQAGEGTRPKIFDLSNGLRVYDAEAFARHLLAWIKDDPLSGPNDLESHGLCVQWSEISAWVLLDAFHETLENTGGESYESQYRKNNYTGESSNP